MQRGVRGSTVLEEFKAYLKGLEEKARQRQETGHGKGQQERGPERERPEGAEGAEGAEEAEEAEEAGRGG
ncbi:hypothetical protein E5D57_014005 [Metarhizium anisopliae]|nr:hypothetical protein E5D57_014005 [Metarhizium anisopliae]